MKDNGKENKFNKRNGKFRRYNKGDNKYDKETKRERNSGKTESNNPSIIGEQIAETHNNDPKWYYANENIGKAVGSIPYNVFAGERINLGVKTGFVDASFRSVPGVLTICYASQPGRSMDNTSAINITSKALYTFVRHQNSGHANYESSDLTMYLLAMDEVYTRYWELRRIYQIAMTYDYVNRNIPDVLLASLYVDADSVRKNIAQFRGSLNILAAKISSLAIPKSFNLFNRHAIIASTILMDSSSMRGQFYMWRQAITHKYDPTTQGGGSLKAIFMPESNQTWDQLIQSLSDLIDPLIADEDINIMSGDILKAFGRENLFVLPGVNENETASFVYDENMLAQIENSCCEDFNANNNLSSMDITQTDNIIISNPIFEKSDYLTERLFNSHKDNPDWMDTLEWSRGMTVNGEFGTEAVVWYHIWFMNNSTNPSIPAKYDITSLLVKSNNAPDEFIRSGLLSMFDWHPIVYLFDANNSTTNTFYGWQADLKKFTILNRDTIKRIHDSAVMGELNALMLAKTSA